MSLLFRSFHKDPDGWEWAVVSRFARCAGGYKRGDFVRAHKVQAELKALGVVVVFIAGVANASEGARHAK